jgi:hypothetical protein
VADRIRRAARNKLQWAVEEVIERRISGPLEEMRATLDATRRELTEARDQLRESRRYPLDVEFRTRRDLTFIEDLDALRSSHELMTRRFPAARRFDHPHKTLRHALGLVSQDGLVLEFGVATGTTLRIIAEELPGRTPYGFDVFTGLPEDWRPGFPAGEFSQSELPEVPGAELVVGLFEETLPDFAGTHTEKVAFLHLDADLYSSTKTVLDCLGDRLVPGTVVLFDEYFNYPGWEAHEHKAFVEFIERTGHGFEYVAYNALHEQVVVRLTS